MDGWVVGWVGVALVLKKKKKTASSAGDATDVGSIPGSGRSPGGGNCNPLQYSCLENSMEGGAWWATVQGARSPVPPLPLPRVCKDAVFLLMLRHLTELAREATADCASWSSPLLVAHSHEETAVPRITAGVHCRPLTLRVGHQGLSFCAQCIEASLGQSPLFSLQLMTTPRASPIPPSGFPKLGSR